MCDDRLNRIEAQDVKKPAYWGAIGRNKDSCPTTPGASEEVLKHHLPSHRHRHSHHRHHHPHYHHHHHHQHDKKNNGISSANATKDELSAQQPAPSFQFCWFYNGCMIKASITSSKLKGFLQNFRALPVI